MRNLWVFETDFFIVQKGLCSIIVVSRFIFTIYDMGIQVVTRVTRGYRGLQGGSWGYRLLQGVTGA